MTAGFLELGNILTRLLNAHDISEAELSRKVHLPRATINRLVLGKTPDPRASTLHAIAQYFNITVDQLLGKSPIYFEEDNVEKESGGFPLLTWNESKNWKNSTAINKNTRITESKNNKDFFCLKVFGEAMWPNFQENTILIVDPHKEPLNKSFVIAYINQTDEVIFRQLIIEGQYKLLKPINPIFPGIELNKDDKIIGTIVETRSSYS